MAIEPTVKGMKGREIEVAVVIEVWLLSSQCFNPHFQLQMSSNSLTRILFSSDTDMLHSSLEYSIIR